MIQQASIMLDGVYYAIRTIAGHPWRIGSITAAWQDIVKESISPDAAVLAQWAELGVWAAPVTPNPTSLCVMCCGLGSVWPGMGRALYDEFPIARKAMDQIAAMADWDILGLLDDPDLDRISQTRWQIPYLFLLEYAQWRQFYSLGLKPAVICGHSLGELIALCFAGIYSIESAWHLLETRAIHMAELESMGAREGGMLAVPATADIIATILAQWPDLCISNRNTDKQFILSGPRESLLQARRQLRKDHIPAVMLNMDLAFHNPAMRILRTISQRRLNGLQMQPCRFTILSCVDAQRYPDNKEQISTRIADLDENAVDWVRLMQTIQADHPCEAFLELGPQETLCGITSELMPGQTCIPADKKGHEALAMRTACARLFAGAFLNLEAILSHTADSQPARQNPKPKPLQPARQMPELEKEDVRAIIHILAEACNRPAEDINMDMELRQDLGIRSSSFPFLMLEAERVLGKPVVLENLFQLTTVGDLALFLTGNTPPPSQKKDGLAQPSSDFLRRRMPVQRYSRDMKPFPIDPLHHGFAWHNCTEVIANVQDRAIWPQIIFGILSQGTVVEAVQPGYKELAARLWEGFLATECGKPGKSRHLKDDPDGFLLLAAPWHENTPTTFLPPLPAGKSWFCALKRFIGNEDSPKCKKAVHGWFADVEKYAAGHTYRAIAWICPHRPSPILLDCADLLVLELLHGSGREIIWQAGPAPRYCKNSLAFRHIRPDLTRPLPTDGNLFQSVCEFSTFRDQSLLGTDKPRLLPLSSFLEAMGSGAALALPWLELAGLTDIRICQLPEISPGITRQCRISSRSRLVLPYDGVMTRICNVELSVATLTPTGRATGTWEQMGSGSCLLALQSGPFPGLWKGNPPIHFLADAEALQNFCAIINSPPLLGEIAEIQLDLAAMTEPGYEARLLPCPAGLTPQLWLVMDALLQGCLWTLNSLEVQPLPELHGIGFIRFRNTRLPDWDGVRLQWHLSWQNKQLIRFDAQICDGSQQVLATVHNIEFYRAPQ